MTTLLEKLESYKIIPVIALPDASQAVPLAQALIENGLACLEITFRTKEAAQAITNLRAAFPSLCIGAGTILTTEQVDKAVLAGADFMVSPGFNPRVVSYCLERKITIIPGVNNPSLVEQAMEMGLSLLKFFPAEPSGGIAMLKAFSAVYPAKFMPTGGISPTNVANYFAQPNVVACGGSWMVPADLIADRNWQKVGELAKEATLLVS